MFLVRFLQVGVEEFFTLSDFHHLDRQLEDLVAFLGGVLVEETLISVHGLKLVIPE